MSEIKEKLIEALERVEEYLKNAKVEEIIENALEIRREQVYVNGKWETLGYKIFFATGGPTVLLDTRTNDLRGYWGAEEWFFVFDDKKVKEIEEYLDEIFSS